MKATIHRYHLSSGGDLRLLSLLSALAPRRIVPLLWSGRPLGRLLQRVGSAIGGDMLLSDDPDTPADHIDIAGFAEYLDGPIPFVEVLGHWRIEFAQPVPFEPGPFTLKVVGDRFLLTTGPWRIQGPCTATWTSR